ncbi:baeRF2 domain-containing protein [Rhizomonospora bruguierae]|uniref:baeRF2 domain-containing protein n=1 Tax=Rhizomonospora bruguierae TaxID=1581705 RepID=UPI001BCF5D10|nr:Vms1/Ankzf1 family peptidyl-tRNA hydrolase [Micromonospora sp. NBRC 107566]
MDSIRQLYEREGPFASVYLNTSRATGNAAHEVELRWHAARDRLREAGADEATLDALERAVMDPRHAVNGGLALFAAHGTVLMSAATTPPPTGAEAHWSALPHVMPLMAGGGERVRWLRAVVDRSGADLETTEAGTLTVRPVARYPMRKVQPGGWSQSRYQRAAETTWKRNQRQVAERLEHLADEVAADVVIVTGELRARQMLMEQLSPGLLDRVVETDGATRAADGAEDEPLDELSARAVHDAAERRRAAMLDTYQVGLPRGRCATGLAEVVPAALESRISALLMNREVDERLVWVDPHEPVRMSFDPALLHQLGIDRAVRETVGDALVAAAVNSGANLMVIDRQEQPLTDGVGAILRYPRPDPQAT